MLRCMIARIWRGRATAGHAEAYASHAARSVFPALGRLAGQRGAWLLRRDLDDGVEFVAVTLWESRRSIEAFTGPDIARSVVEPEARAVLVEFDDFATHYEVVLRAD